MEDAYDVADSIVVAIVVGCREPVSREYYTRGGGDCSLEPVEVLKESAVPRDYRITASSHGCGLSLFVGRQYLVFLDGDNVPLEFSSALENDGVIDNFRARKYRELLRGYKDGQVSDLSEPWFVNDVGSGCSLYQNLSGNGLRFHRSKTGAADPYERDWTREPSNGATVYRSKEVMASGKSQGLPRLVVAMTGDVPDFSATGLRMIATFREREPPEKRQAAITVGHRSWLLKRMEQVSVFAGTSVHRRTEYWLGGKEAEDILAAMSRPANVSAYATLVAPAVRTTEPESPAAASGHDSGNAVFQSPGISTRLDPDRNRARARAASSSAPEPVLSLESRSTHLAPMLDDFRACWDTASE